MLDESVIETSALVRSPKVEFLEHKVSVDALRNNGELIVTEILIVRSILGSLISDEELVKIKSRYDIATAVINSVVAITVPNPERELDSASNRIVDGLLPSPDASLSKLT